MNNLHDYFEAKKQLSLSNQAKGGLYNTINRKIKHRNGFGRAAFFRSKIISVSLIVVLLASSMWYGMPSGVFHNMLGKRWSSNVALADYVGTVISRDGTYQITLDNKQVDTKTDNRIPAGSELVLAQWSKISIRTTNKAQADVVWPAKITFNKANNQLILDVQYSENIEIKQEKTVNNQESSLLTKSDIPDSNELLVLKTDNKTIVSKGDDGLNIALVHKGNDNIITNKKGDISITTLANNKTVELKSNQVAILDAEVRLFAHTDNETKKTEDMIIALIDKDMDTKPIENNTESSDTESTLVLQMQREVNSLLATNENIQVWTASSLSSTSSLLSTSLKLEESGADVLLDVSEDTLALSKTDDQTVYQKIEVTGSKTETLLQSKKVLEGKVLQLLDQLYMTYYNTNNKNTLLNSTKQIDSVRGIIVQLCWELHLSCELSDNSADYLLALRKINTKITSTYIITADIKLVK